MMKNFHLPKNWHTNRIKVLLIGAGGTGSHICRELIELDSALVALGHQGLHVTIADNGVVTNANLARQLFYPVDLGMNKAVALVNSANNLHGKDWRYIDEEIDVNCGHEIRAVSPDLIITAVDKPSVRKNIATRTKVGTPEFERIIWLDAGNSDLQGQVVLGELVTSSDESERLPHVCDLFDYSDLTDDESEIKSCSSEESLTRQSLGVNATAARIVSQLLWNLIRFMSIENQGAFFDCKKLSMEPIPICKDFWAMLGYEKS